MESKTATLKIHNVGPVQESRSVKTTNRWQVLTVSEQPKNPYGHTLTEKPPFEVYVYNHNIDRFDISESLVNEVGCFDLDIQFKRNPSGPGTPIFMVTDLSFKI